MEWEWYVTADGVIFIRKEDSRQGLVDGEGGVIGTL